MLTLFLIMIIPKILVVGLADFSSAGYNELT